MSVFLVTLHRSGPSYDPALPLEEQSGWSEHAAFMDDLVDSGFVVLGGPLADEHRVVLAVEAESDDAVRRTLAADPWHPSHLVVDTVEPWTVRLDSRRRGGA
ncbi:YciI family protein [Marmoricola sp. URHB0036]|uniref:YciI family protein n=1 Tax=Marmoricola sp. URHB0036 TaxID=1298863 RepID=UPI0003FBD106|nr:hypothetical protein [Marmoricola sp. URHB0036]